MSGTNPASTASDGCGAPAGGVSVSAATGTQAVVEGRVTREGTPVSTGYARLLGTGDEFVAEVPLGDDGGFRFFAAPGSWTLRVLAPQRCAGRAVGTGGPRPGDQGRRYPLDPLATSRGRRGRRSACGGRA